MTITSSYSNYEEAFIAVKRLADAGHFDEARRAAAVMGPCFYEEIGEVHEYIDGAFYRREILPLIVGKEYQTASSLLDKILSGELRNQYLSRLIEEIVKPHHKYDALSEIQKDPIFYQRLQKYVEEENSYIQRSQFGPHPELTLKVTRLSEILTMCNSSFFKIV